VTPPVITAASRRPNRQDPGAPARVGAFVCVLALYLGFAGALIALGYGLWPALGAAATACVVAGEVARRVITAGTAPADGPAAPLAPGLPELLMGISRVLDRGSAQDRPGDGQREA
jgi:hypothetical protein